MLCTSATLTSWTVDTLPSTSCLAATPAAVPTYLMVTMAWKHQIVDLFDSTK